MGKVSTGHQEIDGAEACCPGCGNLRKKIRKNLRKQGINPDEVQRGYTRHLEKQRIRDLNREAVAVRRNRARAGLKRHENRLIEYFADGHEVEPSAISPRLIEVQSGSEEELLFRYARLQWSVPISAGYGRRLRYLVIDASNGKLVGLIGLGDPVFAIGSRDRWVGWDKEVRRKNLRHVMDAFILGAVPPYNELLFGKLVALLATSDEVRDSFESKYGGQQGLISGNRFSGELALLTTSSALGRSSLYNRLTYEDQLAFLAVGSTAGSGEFHFSNGLYTDIMAYARHHCTPHAKKPKWGGGWRSRRELIRSVLAELGLSRELLYHGIRRELFVAPLAGNAQEFLSGKVDTLQPLQRPAAAIYEWFHERWLRRRAESRVGYKLFKKDGLRLWGE